MGKGFRLQEYGPELQAAIDKIQALGPASLDEIGVYQGDTEYWNSRVGYIPPKGAIIIYYDARTYVDEESGNTVEEPGLKIGTGNAYVQDLPFMGDEQMVSLARHISDSDVHINAGERSFWNNKLNVDDNEEVVNGVLILNRN